MGKIKPISELEREIKRDDFVRFLDENEEKITEGYFMYLLMDGFNFSEFPTDSTNFNEHPAFTIWKKDDFNLRGRYVEHGTNTTYYQIISSINE